MPVASQPPLQDIMARREEARDAVIRYSQRVLRPALEWDDKPIEATPAQRGWNSLIYFVAPRGGSPVVVRAFEKGKIWKRHRAALETAGRHGAPAPRLLNGGRGWVDRWRLGYWFLATEAAPGKPLDSQPATPQLREAVARALARLHAIESGTWGRPGRWRSDTYAQDLRRGIERRVREIASRPSDFTNAQIQTLRNWMLGQVGRFEGLSSFQLCHHHLGPDDVLHDPATGTVTLIDCLNLQYSRASRDLVDVRRASCMEGEENWPEFLETYYAHSPEPRPREYEMEGEFFEVLVLLSDARNLVLRAPGEGKVSFRGSREEKAYERLLALIERVG